jgi:hypothetical protein
VLLDVTMLVQQAVQQAHCDTLRCNSFSLLQRWNRARRIYSNVAKLTCAARRCGGKRVYMPYVAMGCICTSHFRMVASKYILFPWGTWKGRGKRAAIWCVAARFLCCSWCSSLHADATLLHDDAAHTALQRVARRYGTSCRFLCSWALAWRSHRLAGLALLLVLPAHVDAQTAITNTNIRTAANAWLTNPTTATTTYGPIADWNTAAVTSMATLFYPSSTARPTFNADISKWNVASVSTMHQVRLASVWTAYSFSYEISSSIYTCMHTYNDTYTRARIHTHTHTNATQNTRRHAHAHAHTHTHVYTHTHTRARIDTCMYTRM